MTETSVTHSFQADVNEVLAIVVNSLYSHKEVFLRELISNASDALDQLSFRALTDHSLKEGGEELRIELLADKDARTLTIRDDGVGMTREELVAHLGTIARSGSRALMESLTGDQKKDLSLIGQFGVGFYSAYLVADRVEVISRVADVEETWKWSSDARQEFTVESAQRDSRGTDVVLHLKEGEDEFLDDWNLRQLVRKYSDYVRFPIRLQVERDGGREWETVNSARALWTRPRSEVTDEQYDEFYKHLTHDWQPPLARTHFKVEGTQELTGLLFLPRNAPLELPDQQPHGVRLFVRRVFIMDDAKELLPEWLRFVRGVVDSEDLPLNVSREILQQDRSTRFIRKQIIHKALALLEELADEGEIELTEEGDESKKVTVRRYQGFWGEFGRVLKEGIHYEPEQRERIAKLLRYRSSHQDGWTSLEEYFRRMQEDQPSIYYVTAETREAAEGSPHIEGLRKRGYEVLFMTEPVDEWVVQSLPEFNDKKLVSAAKGALDLPESEEEKNEREEQGGRFEGVVQAVQEQLGDKVKEVRLTHRLTESPACLVTDEQGISPHLERILRANGREVPPQQRILEVNPDHPVIQSLQAMAEDSSRSGEVAEWSQLLYDQSLVAEGSLPEDPAAFARSVARLMQRATGE